MRQLEKLFDFSSQYGDQLEARFLNSDYYKDNSQFEFTILSQFCGERGYMYYVYKII